MLTSQIIKNCLQQLCAITRTQFCVQDTAGRVIAMTEEMEAPDPQLIAGLCGSAVDSQIIGDNYSLKVRDDDETAYVLTANGSGDHTLMIAKVAVSELQNLIEAYKEKLDRGGFFRNLLMDNFLQADIRSRARKLHISEQERRAVILFEVGSAGDRIVSELLTSLFTTSSGDYLTEIDESRVILIKRVDGAEAESFLEETARTAVDMLNMEAMVKVRASYGTVVTELKDLSKSYKEACMAMDVGKIFYAERYVVSYNALGIGRLIYQLPVSLCRMFIREVAGSEEPLDLDNELQTTVNTFLENNLNVSETARQLFVHRNTLVYRIEKLQKQCGMDIRIFDDAMTFRIAMMVSAYMHYLDAQGR